MLELPPYRAPSLRTVLRQGWTSMMNFLVTTRVFIIVGASAIWFLTHLPAGALEAGRPTLAAGIGAFLHPLLGPIGLNPELSVSLFYGFIAKEILLGALAVIHHVRRLVLTGHEFEQTAGHMQQPARETSPQHLHLRAGLNAHGMEPLACPRGTQGHGGCDRCRSRQGVCSRLPGLRRWG